MANRLQQFWPVWWQALRPKTLTLAVTPVLCANALAWASVGWVAPLPIILTLIAAIGVQVGTNLYNDAADFERGVDLADRIGPTRVVASGQLQARQVYRGAHFAFLLAWLAGGYLIWQGGWFIFLLATLSTLAGYAYTAGPKPISATPFGEWTVFLFFGLIAVIGSYYLQTKTVDGAAIVVGCLVGLPAAAVLMVNNYRDSSSDARAGRRTLAIVTGPVVAARIYAFLLFFPFILLPLLGQLIPGFLSWIWLPLLMVVAAWKMVSTFKNTPVSPIFNRLLADTARYQALFGLLLSLALILSTAW
ncbi:MAG: 1,4-dihydroxy-2-naphthoate octaprenyltransferase [Magnetococcales bacterium]|nr:1,4-dihydroxy-2-naphthoate octaprenyltransferase [Magnetococcales bacterium]